MMRPWSRIFGLCITLVFLSIPLASAQLNAEIVASREECVAPCAIFFEGTESTDSNGYYIGDSTTTGDLNSRGLLGNDILEYTWDFGDPSSGTWRRGRPNPDGTYPSKNEAVGFNGAHVYEEPGNYTVRLTVKDKDGNIDSTQVVINVEDADLVYGEGKTVCFANDELNWEGCPSTAVRVATADLFDLQNHIATNKRLLLRRGDTFNYTRSVSLGRNRDITIGAFGTGERPLIQFTGTADNTKPFIEGSGEISIIDLRFYLLSSSGVWGGAGPIGRIGATNLLFLRTDYDHYGAYLAFYANGVFIIDSNISNSLWTSIYFNGRRLAILGSDIGPSGLEGTHDMHNLYSTTNRGVLSNNYFHDGAYTGARIVGNAGSGGWNIVISDNKFERHGAAINIGYTHPGFYLGTQNYLIERNHIYGGFIGGFNMNNRQTVIRNNVIHTERTGQGTIVLDSRVYEGDTHIPVDGLWIYGNTLYSAYPEGVFWIKRPTTPTDVRIFNNIIYGSPTEPWARAIAVIDNNALEGITANNNLYYFPNKPNDRLFVVAGMDYNLQEWQGLTGNPDVDGIVDNPSFVNPNPIIPEDFKLNSSSPAIDAGLPLDLVYEDYDGNARPYNGLWDIGAFEYQGGAGECTNDAQCNDANPCTGDRCDSGSCRYINYNLDGSDTIGLGDIIQIIAYWGGSNPNVDLDENGNVGLSDIIVLLGVWGTYC